MGARTKKAEKKERGKSISNLRTISKKLYGPVVAIVEEEIGKKAVSRADFEDLKSIVKELAEAQREAGYIMKELAEAQKRENA